MKLFFCFWILVATAMPSFAQESQHEAFSAMFEEVAEHWQIPARWTKAIAKAESRLQPWALNIEGESFYFEQKEDAMAAAQMAFDAGKSFDCGLMQVNSFWLRKYDIPLEAIFDPLANIYMGGFILKQEIKRHGLSAKAIGAYHSPNEDKARVYADIILSLLEEEALPVEKIRPAPSYKADGPMLVASSRMAIVKETGLKVNFAAANDTK